MKKAKYFIAAGIPVFAILVTLLFFLETKDYQNFESVKFPYTVGVFSIILFTIIAVQEIKKWPKEEESNTHGTPLAFFRSYIATLNDKKWNPFHLVVLTILYATFLPTLYTIIATFLYIFGFRIILGKFDLKIFFIDLATVFVLFILFHNFLSIPLPSGPVEKAISYLSIQF